MRTSVGAGLRGVLRRGALLLLAGCTAGSAAPAPVELALGTDACEYCHMTVDDPSRAAQWIDAGGRVHRFDEVGCLLGWLQRTPAAAGVGFVADEDGGGWVRAESASYVRGAARTGMGFGVVAFRDPLAAAARARDAGDARVLDWATLRKEGVEDVHAH